MKGYELNLWSLWRGLNTKNFEKNSRKTSNTQLQFYRNDEMKE